MIVIAIKSLIAIAPVVAFLIVLLHLDSHRLIGHHRIAWVFVTGGILALAAYVANGALLSILAVEFETYTRLLAPVVEEVMKAVAIIILFRRDRIGFQVDAAIMGFAGFSFLENLFYLLQASEAHYAIWIVRGFGTAIMHGGCAALFAVVSQILTERHRRSNPLWYLPGLFAAVVLHAVFNHFPVSPILSTVVTLLIIPTLMFLLFERNEVTIHNFLEMDFDIHRRLLSQLQGGEFSGCETGRFLRDLERIHRSPHIGDMITYIHVHTELVLSAESVLLARERGEEVSVPDVVRDKIQLMHELEGRIGKAGMHTLNPHLKLSKHEFWLIHMFEDEVGEMA